jgi:hypothetical protein
MKIEAALKKVLKGEEHLEEAYSDAASNAAMGQDIGAQMLRCMSYEADEPQQLRLMQRAYNTWMRWVESELDEIGAEGDVRGTLYESGKPRLIERLRMKPAEVDDEEEEVEPLVEAGDIPEDAVFLREGGVQLLEKAVRKDGTIPVKIIAPGWGTSGYYSESVLKRDGPKAFPKGTKMFWDHPTAKELEERPERSIDDMAAETVNASRYLADGPKGPGLYTDAKVFEAYKPFVDELAPHIGVSINAPGMGTRGKAEGREGLIVESILPTKLNTVDFVTLPGAGGQILPLFESARHIRSTEAGDEDVTDTEKETQSPTQLSEAAEAQVKQLVEAAIAPIRTENDTLRQENARLSEALTLRSASDFVVAELRKVDLPDITKVRLVESLSKNPPVKDDKSIDAEAFTTKITEAVRAEAEYLSSVGGGRIHGMGSGDAIGGGSAPTAEDSQKGLKGAFARIGLSESVAERAAAGRGDN